MWEAVNCYTHIKILKLILLLTTGHLFPQVKIRQINYLNDELVTDIFILLREVLLILRNL